MNPVSMIQAAVVTISDSTHAGTRADQSGPAVASRLTEAGYAVTTRIVLPDERTQIATELIRLAAELKTGVVFTTGGTGVTPRDVTPEATRDAIEKEIPGFGELMRTRGLASTPTAALSRAVSGTLGGVLIVNLPGSTRGALESLDAVLHLVPHVLDLINGRTGH